MTASTAFIALALSRDAAAHVAGQLLLGGQVASWVGDALLLLRHRVAFFAGLGAFVLAHILYTTAFLQRPLHLERAFLAVPLALVASLVWRILSPHLGPPLRAPVALYVLIISAMVLSASASQGPCWLHGVLGAGLFYLSDLFVARQRFVAPGAINRAVGLPLYYAGQALLAWTLTCCSM